MFQSKVFKRMFFSYILIIAVSMCAYAAFLIYESRQIARTQAERENELLLRAAADVVDDRIAAAQDIVRDLRYSTVMRDLYMSARLGSALDTYADYTVQQELRSISSAHAGLLYGFTVFLDGNTRAYSAGGVVYLPEPFVMPEGELPFLRVGTITDTFHFKNNKRYYYNRRGILYCDSYTWQRGADVGVICAFIDAEETERAVGRLLGEDYGLRVLCDGEELFTVGTVSGKAALTRGSAAGDNLRYELYGSAPVLFGADYFLFGMLLLVLLVSLFFVWLAYWQSKRYYQPIGMLESMVSQTGETGSAEKEEAAPADEMDGIIRGIEELIGEKNRYHEKMLTIGPYAGAGMLQAIVSDGTGGEKLSILTDEDFLDLKHLYYVVAVINFAYEGRRAADEELRGRLDRVFREVTQTWSSEERHIVWYFRDVFDVYLIVNDDVPELSEELFFSLHRQITAAVSAERLMVSMGVDRPREDIAELKTACESAMAALDGVLRDGRGEIFFAEEQADARTDYYFPAGFREQLRGCLERRDRDGVHALLFDIYKKNLDLDAPAEVYRALLDEFYPLMLKTVRETAGLAAVHLNIRRTEGIMSLQEIFDYYDAALMSVIDLLIEGEKNRDEAGRLDEEILRYVDEHFCDQDISLQLLSDRFRVGNKYLLLLFKQRYNMTYLQYLQSRRIERAAGLIREGELTLSAIGERVGYPNQLTFRRNFKAVMGVIPSEYQQAKTQ
ncbi:MAG: AraC family transcriptional regulator [Lachnospiraceae bacterium]|nr:AraC family transcriptional regulator [Lachnospiraceae bacterium]